MIQNHSRQIAFVGTLIVSALIMVLLLLCHLHLDTTPKEWPPKHNAEIALEAPEQYVPLMNNSSPSSANDNNAAKAYAPEEVSNPSQAAPQSGTAPSNSGTEGDAAPVIAQNTPSAQQVPETPQPKKTGAQNTSEADKIARQANSQIANAFKNTQGKNNTTTSSTQDVGKTGSPSGTSPTGSLYGNGAGKAGGGWQTPKYGKVLSTVTGTVEMKVTIDANGNVTDIVFLPGTPRAGTDEAVRKRCAQEVRRHRFTRPASAGQAPPTATAYITYRFQ